MLSHFNPCSLLLLVTLFFHYDLFFFSVCACSPDTRHIFVDVGLGFHVEFTWCEALRYISVREERLAK